jgi:hypothetical protein
MCALVVVPASHCRFGSDCYVSHNVLRILVLTGFPCCGSSLNPPSFTKPLFALRGQQVPCNYRRCSSYSQEQDISPQQLPWTASSCGL